MNNYEIITVATHEYGLFNDLINNKFNIKITVLGMNQIWEGFQMKSKLINEYIKNLADDKIVIIIDGFDTYINKNPKFAIKYFLKNNYKLLISKENNWILDIKKIIFKNTCKNTCKNTIINVGMYIGYVKYVKIILQDINSTVCKDDQVTINKNCKRYDFLTVDINNKIFKNLLPFEKFTDKNSIFLQKPGTISFNRYIYRGIFEYSQFFLFYIIFFYILINLIIIYKQKYNLLFLNIFFIIFLYKIDKSCI